jgi:hydroxymethylpyrimidine/phosphomethylpyrimidine kinase
VPQTPQIGSAAHRANSTGGAAPAVLVLGGLDPSGGSGVVRDLLTARARGARPVVVGTGWTQQGPGVHVVEARAPEALLAAVRQGLAGVAAVKIGMVPNAAAAAAILEGLAGFEGPVVVDPVLASSRGGALWRGTTEELLPLLRRATLVTPNAREAEALTGVPVLDADGAARAATALLDRGARAVLVKGGHLDGSQVTDTLARPGALRRLEHPRVAGGDVRGTGCALATAIAVELARGAELPAAVEAATTWLAESLAASVEAGGERHLP